MSNYYLCDVCRNAVDAGAGTVVCQALRRPWTPIPKIVAGGRGDGRGACEEYEPRRGASS